MGIAGLSFAVLWPPTGTSPVLAGIGFAIVLATSAVQLAAPRQEWVLVEESLASISGVLIIGFGPAVVTPLTLLWLTAVASGVLARGGRAHWVGRALLLIALAMPIVRHQTINPRYAFLYLAAVALLLTCGRVTQELRKMLDQARYDADHDGLTGALSPRRFATGWTGSPLTRATRARPPCCSSTSTTSVRSTRPPVTPPAMPGCASSWSGCRPPSAPTRSSGAWAATSLRRSSVPRIPRRSPRRC